MKIIIALLKYCGFGLSVLTVVGIGYFGFRFWNRNMKSDEVITIEATFMQYACGDENDDIQITRVSDKKHKALIGKDVDPQVTLIADTYELKDYFYNHRLIGMLVILAFWMIKDKFAIVGFCRDYIRI